jgi:Bifunctional DNA primase/polymerase, N-terminal
MAKSVLNPNPQLSYLDGDGQVKEQIAKQTRWALEMAQRQLEAPPLSDEELEAERFQFESNEYAADNARYAAARAATNFLVVPLDGTTPLVDLSEATREPRKLFAWWLEYPDANPGALLGRMGGIFALAVDNHDAWERLKEMAAVTMRDADNDKTWIEHRHIGGARVHFLAPSQPFSVRSRGGWGRTFEQAAKELAQESRNRNPQTFALVWSYPSVQSGMDAYDFKSRKIGQGLSVMAEGEVFPWSGSILADGIEVQAPMSRPPEAPLWLAKLMGKPRSRKAMAAVREAYEADLRASNAYWMGVVRAQREAGEHALREALAEREKADKAAQEAS